MRLVPTWAVVTDVILDEKSDDLLESMSLFA